MKMVKGQHYWWALRRCRFIAASRRPSLWKHRVFNFIHFSRLLS